MNNCFPALLRPRLMPNTACVCKYVTNSRDESKPGKESLPLLAAGVPVVQTLQNDNLSFPREASAVNQLGQPEKWLWRNFYNFHTSGNKNCLLHQKMWSSGRRSYMEEVVKTCQSYKCTGSPYDSFSLSHYQVAEAVSASLACGFQ